MTRNHDPVAQTLRDCRILLVEDHPDTAKVLERAITKWVGVRCSVAGSVSDAKRQFEAASAAGDEFHLVICDLMLPGGSGLQLPALLRPGVEGPQVGGKTQLIAVSAMASMDDEERSLAAGFDAHLRKPFNLGALVAVVTRLLNRSHCNGTSSTVAASA